MKLKMLSFNIRCANDPDGHSIPERAPRVAELLREHKADIVGFQEYHLRWDASWSSVTDPDYEEMKVDRGDGEGLVLWWRRDSFRCLQKGHFWFGDDPNSPSTDWDEKYHKPRICAYPVLEDVKSKTVFTYLNVHYGFGAAGQIRNAVLLQQFAENWGILLLSPVTLIWSREHPVMRQWRSVLQMPMLSPPVLQRIPTTATA